jgi:hypothetical protein
MNAKDITVSLYANGTLVKHSEPQDLTLDDAPPGGRAMALANLKVPLDMQVVVTFDPAQIAAIHARTTYGFKTLRAMIDDLPQCQAKGCREQQQHPATHSASAILITPSASRTTPTPAEMTHVRLCDSCAEASRRAGNDVTELPSAPAVRHLEGYVLDYEREHAIPKGER